MNNNLARLYELSRKNERLIIGLMSGTSLDGLDIALCRITGSGLNTGIKLLEFETIPYQQELREDIKEVFSKRQVDLEKLTLLNELIGTLHGGMILGCLKKWGVDPKDVDCIASHGQTIYHAPRRLHQLEGYPNATLQIGDGDHISIATGILTLCDFRQKHVAGGGEGAPLAFYGDYLLFTSKNENRVLLNIGGISNFTFLPSDGDPAKFISSDIGPGNTLINTLAQSLFNQPFDKDGLFAEKGNVNKELLNRMLGHSFFREDLPKTCGPELFNLRFIENAKGQSGVSGISDKDLIATVTRLTAEVIANSVKQCDFPLSIYASGGGCHNPVLMNQIRSLLPGVPLKTTQDLGINPDAKEAILFAILANETLSGSSVRLKNWPAVTLGKICLPD